MQKNSQNFSMQEALHLAHTDAGQQLLALLRRSESTALQQAMDRAAAGDYKSAQAALSDVLDSPEFQALLKQLEG